jgi:hypothetical protein
LGEALAGYHDVPRFTECRESAFKRWLENPCDPVTGDFKRVLRQQQGARFCSGSVVFQEHAADTPECRGIARNVLAHHFRTQRRQVALLSRAEPEGHTLLAQAPHDPEHTFATRELLTRIFDNFDERSRGLMIERYLMGRSADEIAKQAAQSPTSVRMKLMRVRGAAKINVCAPSAGRRRLESGSS